MSNYIDNFLSGMAFGMLANNPFFGGCFGFGIYGGMYNRVDFNGFANPFPSVFGSGFYNSSSAALIPPSTFANPSFPSVDFTEVGLYLQDTFTNPDSEYNKRIREAYKEYEKQSKESKPYSNQQWQWQFQFPSFYMPQMSINPFMSGRISSKKEEKIDEPKETDNDKIKESYTNRYNDKRFNKFLTIILGREGGYSNNKNDKGGETYKGITHSTYDQYRRSKGLPTRNVTEMTDDEMQEIYYENYYKASGADKISDKKLALYVFDTAVNMGVKKAKELYDACDGDRNKFEQLRKNRYKQIIENDESQKVFENGWNDRMVAIKNAADNELDAIA